MADRLTTLELIADRLKTAQKAENRHRDACETWQEARRLDMKSYRQGEAAAYHDAYNITKRELERLRHLWQNGSLSYSSFGLPY